MKLKHRALALLLSVAMVLTFMPAMAFAEEAPADANDQPVASEEQGTEDADEAAAEAAAKEAEEQAAAEAAAKEAAEKEAAEQAAKEAAENEGDEGDAETFTLTFEPNGGYFDVWDEAEEEWIKDYSALEMTVGEGETQISLDIYRDGYKLLGWSTEQSGSVEFDFNKNAYNFTKDETFYAQWKENPKVTLDPNGGYMYVDDKETYKPAVFTTYYYGEDGEDKYFVNDAPYAWRNGYDFLGWSTSNNAETGEDLDRIPVEDGMTLYAVYTRQEGVCIVTFDAGDGTFDNGMHKIESPYDYYEDGEVYIDSYDEPFLEGKALSYWTDQDGNRYDLDSFREGFTITKDTIFTAAYENGYKVTYKADKDGKKKFRDDDDNLFTEHVDYVRYNSYVYTPWYVSEDGRESVIGWMDENGNQIDEEEYTVTNDNTVLYAIWGKRVKIILNAMEGTLDDEKTAEAIVNQNEELEGYCPWYIESDIPVAFTHGDVPRLEGSVFTGWYTDEERTNLFTQERATAEYIEGLEDATQNLYAGYTTDFSTITIHLNGGESYKVNEEGQDSFSMDIANGSAIRIDEMVSKSTVDGKNYRITGWYSDAEFTQKVETIDDGYYVANGNIDLYPAWGEPLPDVSVELDADNDFYLDGDYELKAKIDSDEGADLSGLDYIASISVYDVTQGGREDIGELTPVKVLDTDDYITWDVNNSAVILHGPAISSELESLDAEIDNIVLYVNVEIKTDSGESICSDNRIVIPREAYVEYDLDYLLGENGEPVVDHKFELMLGDDDYYDEDSRWFDSVRTCKKYSYEYPDGEEFEYEITGVISSNSGIVAVEDYDGEFDIFPVGFGTADITIEYDDLDGNPQSETYQVEVVKEKYYVSINDEEHFDRDEDMVVRRAVPGGKVVFEAEGTRRDVYGFYKDGFTYKWSFADASAAEFATIKDNGSTAEVTIKEDVDPENAAIEDGIRVKVEVLEKGQTSRAATIAKIYVYDEFYEIANVPELNTYMRTGSTVNITPEVRHFSTETKDNGVGYEVVNMPVSVYYDDGIYSDYDDDEEDEDYEDGDEIAPVFTITSGGKTLLRGDSFTGTATIKRIGDDEGEMWLAVEREDEFDGSFLAEKGLSVERIYNISKAKVTGIKAQTYTGKARKPVPEDVYIWDEDGDERYLFREDGDYSISYKNNVKVGTASLLITGKGQYYGTRTVNFNINPKGTSISKLKAAKKSFTVTWKKQATQTTGYQIQYGLKSNFKGAKTTTIKKTKTVKTTIKKLKSKKTYYVRIRTYKKIGKKTYYSSWSKAKKIKVK